MRKFILTSDAFDGSIELMYDNNGVLKLADMRNTNMDYPYVSHFIKKLPASIDSLFEASKSNVTIVESEYTVTFDQFWHEYPYKRNKHLAEPVFNKMSLTDRVLSVEAARAYRQYAERNNGWYKPKIADLWLKSKQYLNDWKSL